MGFKSIECHSSERRPVMERVVMTSRATTPAVTTPGVTMPAVTMPADTMPAVTMPADTTPAERAARAVFAAWASGDLERVRDHVTDGFIDHGAPPGLVPP